MKKQIDLPESDTLEFKSCENGTLPKDTWESIVAFSNTDGGTILFGINPNGLILSLSNSILDKIQQDVASLCDGAFNHKVYPLISSHDGYITVRIDPLPAVMRPLYSKKRGVASGTFVRIGSTDQRATGEDIKRFAIAAQGGAKSISYKVPPKEILDATRIQDYIQFLNSKHNNMYQNFSDEEVLRKQRVITDNGMITLFGLLAFGKGYCPQEIIAPTVNIGLTHYPNADKVLGDATLTYDDNREFNGNVVEQFERAFAFIKSKLPVRGMIGADGRRQDYLVIPEVAIREALANAIVHRDYSILASRVQVDIYANRIETINPGRSLMPISELDTTQSMTRNPLTMNFLKELGYTEQKARGIRTIKQTIREAGLQAPEFENMSSSFKATLFTSAFVSAEDKVWLGSFRNFRLKDRQLNALVYMRNNINGISNGEYRGINNMDSVGDDKMANRELRKLVELGLASTSGKARFTKYVISERYK